MSNPNGMRLVIDPGHGGTAPGAIANGIIEKDLVLELAHDLEVHVNGLGWAEAELTRRGGETLSLRDRGRLSREFGADFVLSVHANAASPKARGLMAFYWPGNNDGRHVAMAIQHAAPLSLSQRFNKPPYEATWLKWNRVNNVLRFHEATSILVEVGFLTNSLDATALKMEGVRREVIASMLAGVAKMRTLYDRR